MNRETYLKELRSAIRELPVDEKNEIVADYEEHFRVGMSEGKTEEEISRSLGNPKTIAKSIRIESMLEEVESRNAATVLRAVFATVSLGFFNVVVVLGPFVAVVSVVISLWAAAASIALSGLAVVLGVIGAPIFPAYITLGGLNPAFLVFAGIGTAALGLLSLIGMWKLSKWVVFVIGRYVRLNARIVSAGPSRDKKEI